MNKYTYTLKRYACGWSWEVGFPKETTYGIGMGTGGWSFTKWGAIRAIKKAARRHFRSKLSKERGQVVVRD